MYLRARKYDLFTAWQSAEHFTDSEPRHLADERRIPYRCELHSGPMNRWIERLR
jgi:hypothetical protein